MAAYMKHAACQNVKHLCRRFIHHNSPVTSAHLCQKACQSSTASAAVCQNEECESEADDFFGIESVIPKQGEVIESKHDKSAMINMLLEPRPRGQIVNEKFGSIRFDSKTPVPENKLLATTRRERRRGKTSRHSSDPNIFTLGSVQLKHIPLEKTIHGHRYSSEGVEQTESNWKGDLRNSHQAENTQLKYTTCETNHNEMKSDTSTETVICNRLSDRDNFDRRDVMDNANEQVKKGVSKDMESGSAYVDDQYFHYDGLHNTRQAKETHKVKCDNLTNKQENQRMDITAVRTGMTEHSLPAQKIDQRVYRQDETRSFHNNETGQDEGKGSSVFEEQYCQYGGIFSEKTQDTSVTLGQGTGRTDAAACTNTAQARSVIEDQYFQYDGIFSEKTQDESVALGQGTGQTKSTAAAGTCTNTAQASSVIEDQYFQYDGIFSKTAKDRWEPLESSASPAEQNVEPDMTFTSPTSPVNIDQHSQFSGLLSGHKHSNVFSASQQQTSNQVVKDVTEGQSKNRPQSVSDLDFVDEQYFKLSSENPVPLDNMAAMANITMPYHDKSRDQAMSVGTDGSGPTSFGFRDKDVDRSKDERKKARELNQRKSSNTTAFRASDDSEPNENQENRGHPESDKSPRNLGDRAETKVKQKSKGTRAGHSPASVSTEGTGETAFDVGMKIREQLRAKSDSRLHGKADPKELDSKGFHILKHQVPNFQNALSSEILEVLEQSVLYNDNDIVAINKPYGLPAEGNHATHFSIQQLLEKLANKLDPDLKKLHLVSKLDKDTTGVMLLAKTTNTARRITEAVQNKEAVMKYLAITKNFPEHRQGVVDIPIAKGILSGKHRMVLRPDYGPDRKLVTKKRPAGSDAVTEYSLVSQQKSCALIECQPKTVVKHQLRVHLSFGLNCPILGDHKYSHIDRMAPQKLHPEMLRRLKIRQTKVRHVPLHLHCRSILLPEFVDGTNLMISAPLPIHFIRNMKDLKLKLPAGWK